MKLLLCKNVAKLGIVGEVVNVAAGYGRNYLVPQGLATAPTDSNVRALAEQRKVAEEVRTRELAEMKALAERVEGVEVTIKASVNEEGVLYGSVGKTEIADALAAEGYPVAAEFVVLQRPIRQLDNISINLKLVDGVPTTIKVWVVRDKPLEGEEAEGAEEASQVGEAGDAGTEADQDGDSSSD